MIARKSIKVPKTFRDVLRRKTGLAGVILVSLSILTSVLAPILATNDPNEPAVADDYALPMWMAFLPGSQTMPRNFLYEVAPTNATFHPDQDVTGAASVSQKGQSIIVTLLGNKALKKNPAALTLSFDFNYTYSEPRTFLVRIPYNITTTGESFQYRAVLSLVDLRSNRSFILSDSYPPWRSANVSRWRENEFKVSSRDIQLVLRLGLNPLENLARDVFAKPGPYRMTWQLLIRQAQAPTGTLRLALGKASIRIPGLAYGLLGTNKFGEDIFSQYVYGSRVSLLVGLLSVSIIVSLGLMLGVYSGYKGGVSDRLTIFLADTVIQIPIIPTAILVLLFIGRSVFYIIAVIALLSWAGLARQIRSWVLSLKERPFVEAARAAGAGELYMMYKVIAPQTIPIVAVALALGVPGGIFAEAGISILGFGDPTVISWGKMINEVITQGGIARFAWWWISPPIIGILALALGFVFIGFTLDELLNPRLRRTR